MFFKNAIILNLTALPALDLSQRPLAPCGPSELLSVGWVPPTESGEVVHAVAGHKLIALGIEHRLLPAAVVKRAAAERAKEIEEAEGRRVGRRELRDLRETLQAELTPRALIQRRTTYAWIDQSAALLVIDASTSAKADEVAEHLHKSVEGFGARLPATQVSAMSAMTSWVAAGEAPAGFTIDQDLELRSPDNAVVRYAKHNLEGDEIRQHIAQGKVVTRLALTWRDKVSFVLNDKLQIKRLVFLDILKEQAEGQAENEAERFDLDFALMAGELSLLIADLMHALGGEAA